ncbi:uncharacterized protein LOC141619878 [Silene latifolia]|uniref:uncharacterized protein LOC141619878 n=1 Tax=Silene latifolia TaxID=37657 RepID=UPI003D789C13
MGKTPTIIEFLKRKNGHTSTNQTNEPSPNTTTTEDNVTTHADESRPTKIMRSLEPETDSYLVERDPGKHSNRVFIVDGFKNWKYAMGKEGAYNIHVGTPNSPHKNAKKQLKGFLHQEGHLANIYAKQTPIDIAKNRLRLTSSIEALRWLALQGLTMRGRDESENSNIQIEILQIFRDKIKQAIRDEIGGHPFCIIVDEAGDVSRKQQMAIILRFVNNFGLVNELLFSIVHVDDTCALTLKKEIFEVLSHYHFDLKNLRGQGYDGASNRHGNWKGLQALVIEQCPYAYFVHCFAHHLQLALVAATKDVVPIFQFFSKLSFVVNHILSSYK